MEIEEGLVEQQALALETYQSGITFYLIFMGVGENIRNAYDRLVEQQKINNGIDNELCFGISQLVELINNSNLDINTKADLFAKLTWVDNKRKNYVNKTNEIDYQHIIKDLDNAQVEFENYIERMIGYKKRIESATSVSEIEAVIAQMNQEKTDMENNYLNPLNTDYNSLLQSIEDCKGYEIELRKLRYEDLEILKHLYWEAIESGVETAIMADDDVIVVNLRGERITMKSTQLNTLPKGIYIVNGKKVIIK